MSPLLITIPDILNLLSISRTTFYQLVSTGQFGPEPLKVFGKKRLYKYADIQDWIDKNCPPQEKYLKLRRESN